MQDYNLILIGEWIESLKTPEFIEEDGKMPENTWDCHLDECTIPVVNYVISDRIDTWEEAEIFIDKNIKNFPFVKTCQFSPKDWRNPPVFKTSKEAIEALQNSTRCSLGKHIVMKKERNYTTQSRIYWFNDRPTAACGDMPHNKVLEFLEKYKDEIPFHYCCIEIGQFQDNVELIEFNTFSTLCDPSPLSWSQNWYELMDGSEITWGDVEMNVQDP